MAKGHKPDGRLPAKRGSRSASSINALQALLKELALTLLPHGMTPKRLSELTRYAFVEAAAEMSHLRNGRVNQSRVAAQTGLTRADVKRCLNISAPREVSKAPLQKVVDAWCNDRRYSKPGRPKRLRISGQGTTFSSLVRRSAGDLPHRAVLDELLRMGAVVSDKSIVRLRPQPRPRRRLDYAFLLPVLPALVDGLRIASRRQRDVNTLPSILRLTLPVETDVDLAIVRERCASGARSLLDALGKTLGRQVTVPRKKESPAHSFTVTVLLAENRAKRRHLPSVPHTARLRAV